MARTLAARRGAWAEACIAGLDTIVESSSTAAQDVTHDMRALRVATENEFRVGTVLVVGRDL